MTCQRLQNKCNKERATKKQEIQLHVVFVWGFFLRLLLRLLESVHSAAASRGQMAAYKCLVAAVENLCCRCGRGAPYFGKACSGCQDLLQCLPSSRLTQPTRQPDAARVSRIKKRLRFSFLSLNENDHQAFDGVYRKGKTLTCVNEKTPRAVGTHTRSHAHALHSVWGGIMLGPSCSRCQDTTAFCSEHQTNISPQSLQTPSRFFCWRSTCGSPAGRHNAPCYGRAAA